MSILHIAQLDHTPPPSIAPGDVLAAVPILASEVAAGCGPIMVDVASQASGCSFNDAAVLEAGITDETTNFPAGLIRVFPDSHEVPLRYVRPCVEKFIKRVIVPILVRRFIAQRNCGRLPARAGETL